MSLSTHNVRHIRHEWRKKFRLDTWTSQDLNTMTALHDVLSWTLCQVTLFGAVAAAGAPDVVAAAVADALDDDAAGASWEPLTRTNMLQAADKQWEPSHRAPTATEYKSQATPAPAFPPWPVCCSWISSCKVYNHVSFPDTQTNDHVGW